MLERSYINLLWLTACYIVHALIGRILITRRFLHFRADSRFGPANERWRYFVTTSLIGLVQTKNQPWFCVQIFDKQMTSLNSLAPRTCGSNLKIVAVISKLSVISTLILAWYHEDFLGNCSHVNATECIDNESTSVQVMASWCQRTSVYLSQCWPRARLPYDTIMAPMSWLHSPTQVTTLLIGDNLSSTWWHLFPRTVCQHV